MPKPLLLALALATLAAAACQAGGRRPPLLTTGDRYQLVAIGGTALPLELPLDGDNPVPGRLLSAELQIIHPDTLIVLGAVQQNDAPMAPLARADTLYGLAGASPRHFAVRRPGMHGDMPVYVGVWAVRREDDQLTVTPESDGARLLGLQGAFEFRTGP